ncbi:MAG: 50S ribosomal protein L11 methyltransferase [Vicinamibacterales bacterium]
MTSPRYYPALDVHWSGPGQPETVDLLLATIDESSPTALEEREDGLRLFFSSDADRERARALVDAGVPGATTAAVAVSDESWAERSQAALQPITVGRITVAPPWTITAAQQRAIESAAESVIHRAGSLLPIVIAIQPSMGFGTGHHQSTRLCLQLLQQQNLQGRSVIDVGTGSGVLAMAAWRLGAHTVLALDYDPDAVTSARENIARNHATGDVMLEVADIARSAAGLAGRFDLLLANLTGGVLIRLASLLIATLADGGVLIASGFQADEAPSVFASLQSAGSVIESEATEDSWVAVALRRVISSSPSTSTAR